MIDLYTWSTPNGRKISIALEELGLPYTVHAINITKGEQRDPAFLAVSPNGKIPAIVDTDTGIRMMESGAILLYLAQKTGKLMPSGEKYWEAMEWLMWQMGGLGPVLGQVHHFVRYNKGVSEYSEERYTTEANRLYGVLDERLDGRDFIVDDFSVVDCACFPWIARWDWQEQDLNKFPNVKRWFLAMAARPAVQRGYIVPSDAQAIPMPE
ncbi:MAG: glutathione S-transferase [Alphaproteobacteria bacterium]|nr:glutathione S-transferase [Alphaproteobacteria bacterium]